MQVGDLGDFEIAFLVSVLFSLQVDDETREVDVGGALSDDHREEDFSDWRGFNGAVEGEINRADLALDVLVINLIELDKLQPLLDLPQGHQVRHLRCVYHNYIIFHY